MIINTDRMVIEVKSDHEKFVKEATGVKPFTASLVSRANETMLKTMAVRAEEVPITIIVTDNVTKEEFRRQVTDVDYAGEILGRQLVTIAWKHTG